MPTLTTTLGALQLGTYLAADLADAEVHLFQVDVISITPNTTLAELEAIEADFTGYAPATVATWIGPMLAPITGAMVQSPTLEFGIDAPYTVPNNIMGWWLQDSLGNLLMIGTPPDPVPMVGPGNLWAFSVAVATGGNS